MKQFIKFLTPTRCVTLMLATLLSVAIAIITARALFLDIVGYQKIIALAVFSITLIVTTLAYALLIAFFFESKRLAVFAAELQKQLAEEFSSD